MPRGQAVSQVSREKSAGSRASHSAHDTARRHSLEHPHNGQGAGHQPDGGSAYLGSPRPQASSDQDFQAQRRQTFCRKALRCGRLYLNLQTRPWSCASTRKAKSRHSIVPSQDCRSRRGVAGHDARLQAQRHDHTVRRAEHARWQSDRRLHAGVIDTRNSFVSSTRSTPRRRPISICILSWTITQPQTPAGQILDASTSQIPHPLHPDVEFLVESGRALVSRDYRQADSPRQFP